MNRPDGTHTSLRDRLFAESQNYGLHEDVRRLLREAHDELDALVPKESLIAVPSTTEKA